MRKLSCAECCYLNKNKKEQTKEQKFYRYGCSNNLRGYIIGWISKDSELKTMGCSDCNRVEIGTLFKLKSEEHVYTILYCGKVNNQYLLYNQNLKTFKLVKRTWFSEHIKDIVIEHQTEKQIEAQKQTARLYKRRVIKREEENRR